MIKSPLCGKMILKKSKNRGGLLLLIDNSNNSLILPNGKYDSEKIYDLVYNENVRLSTIEFKYGIHKNDLLTILNEYHESHCTEEYSKEAYKGDVVSSYFTYEYNIYFIIGEVMKRNINSVMVQRIDGDELPMELLNRVILPIRELNIVKKKS